MIKEINFFVQFSPGKTFDGRTLVAKAYPNVDVLYFIHFSS